MTAPDSTAELLTDVSSSAIHNDHWDEINGLEGRLWGEKEVSVGREGIEWMKHGVDGHGKRKIDVESIFNHV